MTTVYDDASGAPGLQALVIGVGQYGAGAGVDAASLGAAVPSAQAVARWLHEEYRSAEAPLRSLELLLSGPDPSALTTFAAGSGPDGRPPMQMAVERAYLGLSTAPPGVAPFGVAWALQRWFERANRHLEDVALLHVCGHGVEVRGDPHFLCAGFDTASRALTDALNLRELVSGMEQCQARRQLFLFDCCREVPSWAMAYNNPAGAPIQGNVDRLPVNAPPRRLTVAWATKAHCRARADDGRISRFSHALLQVLRGPACDRERGAGSQAPWKVSTRRIIEAIEDLLDAGILPPWEDQEPHLAEGDRFTFHEPAPPLIPVVLEVAGALPAGASITVNGQACQPLDAQRFLGYCPPGETGVRVLVAGQPAGPDTTVLVHPTWARGAL